MGNEWKSRSTNDYVYVAIYAITLTNGKMKPVGNSATKHTSTFSSEIVMLATCLKHPGHKPAKDNTKENETV